MSKPILCLDFDGVLHSYISGWKGATEIPDPPVPGALEFLEEATRHFSVCIYSSRSNQPGGRDAMLRWLIKHAGGNEVALQDAPAWVSMIAWPDHKPPALVTLDDRAICFTGVWPSMAELRDFKPWNKRQ